MFSNLKKSIRELAQTAAAAAEQALGSGTGKEKKQMAVDYIVSNIPVKTVFMKKVISVLLSSFIDDAVEIAVDYLHTLSEKDKEKSDE